MSWRVTLVLAIAVTVTALYAWFDLPRGVPSSSQLAAGPSAIPSMAPAKPLVEFTPEEVEAIHLRLHSAQVQLRREGNGWTGVQRPDVADDFLTNLHDMQEIIELQASQKDLADYGLDPPEDRIELLLHEGGPITLFLGKSNPAGTAIYVQIGRGGRVVLAGALLRWELDKLTHGLTEAPQKEVVPSRAP
jgi:hypothetical protein